MNLAVRQKLVQSLQFYLSQRGASVTSPLPLCETDSLRFDVGAHEAAHVSGDLSKAGFAVKFVAAGLQMRPNIEMIGDNAGGIEFVRHVPGPCAVSTFEIRLPQD